MVGLRSVRAATFAFLFLLAGSGCKCDKDTADKPGPTQAQKPEFESTVSKLPGADQVDVARLVPAGVDLAVWADSPDKVHAWLAGRGWWKAIVASPVWEDLALSGPLYELSTARHRLASMSPVEFAEPELQELLASPMALALRRSPKGTSLLVIKQIDLKVQALARLAEVFNQAKATGELKSRALDGIELKSFELGSDQAIHYALFSNLLLVSNDEGLVEQAVGLASGEQTESLVTAKPSAALFDKREPTDVGAYLDPAGISRWLHLVLPLDAIRLDWRLGQTPSATVFGLAEQDGQGPEPAQGTSQVLGKLIPLDSRLALAHTALDVPGLWAELAAGLGEGETAKPQIPAGAQGLMAALTGEVALVVTRFELPVPQASVLLRAKPGALAKPASTQVVAQLLGLIFGSQPEAGAEPGDIQVWTSQGGQIAPAFAVAGDWLVVGSSAGAVRAVVATQQGKAPALTDRAGFTDRVAGVAEPFFSLSYLDCEALFGDMLATARQLMASSERFDANDFDDTLAPLLEALKGVGRLGGGLGRASGPGRVSGSVVAL